ncbi:MAG: hypothetical protein RLY58_1323, partial [Pseudomonadota bacterium]
MNWKWRDVRHSIFVRIYAGLILVCLLVGLFAYVLIQSINAQRVQNYREDIASGAFFLITEGIARQPDAVSRQNWLDDASLLLSIPLSLVPTDQIELSRSERERLDAKKAVVRYNTDKVYGDIYAQTDDPNRLLYGRVDKVSEQQIKAMAVFLLDDLVHYPAQEE